MMLQQVVQTVAANVPLRINMVADYFRLLLAAQPVDIKFYLQQKEVGAAIGMDTGFYLKGEDYDCVEVVSATAQPLKLMLMQGDGGYDRFNVDITSALSTLTISQANTVNDIAPVTVGTVVTALVAANGVRKGIRFTNNGTVPVAFGGAGVTMANAAIVVQAGNTWVEDDAGPAAWYGISGTAGQSVKIQELIG